MKFEQFKYLVEQYKKFSLEGKKEESENILKEIDPQGLGLKRFFIVKKYRVERVIESYCEKNNIELRYSMKNITNRGYDFYIKLNNEDVYKIRCQIKKSITYMHLKNLYREVENEDGLYALTEKYPEIAEGLWKTVLDTANEQKRREIVSIDMRLNRNS